MVEIKGNGTIRGSVIANSIEATGNTDIIFDDSIMDAFADIIEASTGGGSSYSKGLWQ